MAITEIKDSIKNTNLPFKSISIRETKIPFKLTSVRDTTIDNKETESPFSIIESDNIIEKEIIKDNNNNDKKLYDLPVDQILIRTKDVILEVLDELLENKFTIESLNKGNRMFFIGVSIILTTILLYFFYELVSKDDNNKNNSGINITYN
jgi:hypothetical protein